MSRRIGSGRRSGRRTGRRRRIRRREGEEGEEQAEQAELVQQPSSGSSDSESGDDTDKFRLSGFFKSKTTMRLWMGWRGQRCSEAKRTCLRLIEILPPLFDVRRATSPLPIAPRPCSQMRPTAQIYEARSKRHHVLIFASAVSNDAAASRPPRARATHVTTTRACRRAPPRRCRGASTGPGHHVPPRLRRCRRPRRVGVPITQCLMTEPALVVSSGRTYERAAIVRWIQQHGVDPLDRGNVLRVDQLAPNLAVRQMVETWARQRCGGVLPTQDVRGGSVPVATPPPSIAALVDAEAAAADRPTQEPNPAPAERTNASLATRPFAGEDDPIVDGAITVLGHYRAPGAPPSEDGKFFLFSSARLAKVLRGRGWASHGVLADAGGHVKNGAGATAIVTNSRTGKTGGCLLWGAGGGSTGVGVGCWNPAEYSEPGSFRRGDVLVLPDFVGADVPAAGGVGSGARRRQSVVEKVLTPARVTKNSGTGWNLAGTRSRSGGAARRGLVAGTVGDVRV